MTEFILFALSVLLGIFYWAYRRSRSDDDARFAALTKRIHQLDSELKSSNEARGAEINSRLGELKREVEALQSRLAGLEKHEAASAAPLPLVHEAPLPARAESRVVAEPPVPKIVEAPPAASVVPKPVPIPPASAIPPLSSDAVARLSEVRRPGEAQFATTPQHAAPTSPASPPVAKTAPPIVIEPTPRPPQVTPPHPPVADALKPAPIQTHAAAPGPATARPPSSLPAPHFTLQPPPGPPMTERLKRLLNFEEILGTNYLIKLGVVILVIGISGFILSNLDKIPTWAQLLAGFLAGLAMLMAGARYETGRYRILARAGMGGGWAVIFFTTWALHHAGKQPLLSSEPIDLVLMLIVAAAMVKHTLKYNSQLVTGFAFMLPTLTVTVTLGFASGVTDAVRIPGLVGSALLAVGLVVLVLRRRWFEMEVFGILTTFLNHYFWIRPIIEHGTPAERSASLMGSAALLVAYWAIFRASYIIRKVDDARHEAISSVAALLNTFLLLGLLKYQAAHPELAFWFLLALGAVELTLGQLPITRRRRTAFIILTTLGATFLTAALPFKFSGATLPVILLAEAEIFFLAGVFTREIVFRRLGMLAGLLVAGKMDWTAIGQIADSHFNGLGRTDAGKAAVVYGLTALVFYANAHAVTRRWPDLVTTAAEDWSFRTYSYIAGSVAFLGLWLIFPTIWVPVVWSALALVQAVVGERLKIRQLSTQVPIFTVAAAAGVLAQNFSATGNFHHLSLRLLTVSLVAAIFYLTSRWERKADLPGAQLIGEAHTWAATALLGILVWYECPEMWRAVTWSAMALALALVGRGLKLREFSDQAHFLAGAGFVAALEFNLLNLTPHHYEKLPLETVLLTAALLYACSRHIRLTRFPGETLLSAAHTWAATLLLALLPWYQLRAEYAAPAWIALAFALAVVGRVQKLKRFSFQAYALALTATAGVVFVNLVGTSPHTHIVIRLGAVSFVAAMLYVCSRWAALVEMEGAREISALHTWLGTGLLAALAWYETPTEYSAPIWCGMALALVVLGSVLRRRSLAAQGHCLAAAGITSALVVNLQAATLGHYDARLLATVGICAALLYLCSPWSGSFAWAKEVRIPEAYTWAGSTLVFLLGWYELQPLTVAVGWALFGIVLFELGFVRRSGSLRWQSYAAVVGSFARIFYVNINATGNPGEISPRVWTLVFLATVFFYVYARLAAPLGDSFERDRKLKVSPILCYFGAITLAALVRAELDSNWVVAAWAGIVVVLLALAWRLRLGIFLEQGLILSVAVLYRTVLFNFYQNNRILLASEHSRLLYVGVTVALLFLAVPLALQLRPGAGGAVPLEGGLLTKLTAILSRHPEQVVFFIAFGLLTALLYLEISNTVTLVWGLEALLVFLFALWAGVRSFRLAAIGLLLVCVGRLMLVDLWRFEGNSRWLTGIGLGMSLILVGYMFIRFREAIRKYL